MHLSIADYANLSRESFWFVVAVGVTFSIMTLVLGQAIFRRRRPKVSKPKADAEGLPMPKVFQRVREKRSFARRSGNAVAVFWTDAPGEENLCRASVIDRSAGGLCLLLDDPVEIGKVLRVRPCCAPGTAPWVEVHVRSCRKEAGQWELGCQFVTIPGFSVLLLFG
jgi:hypothetical protein